MSMEEIGIEPIVDTDDGYQDEAKKKQERLMKIASQMGSADSNKFIKAILDNQNMLSPAGKQALDAATNIAAGDEVAAANQLMLVLADAMQGTNASGYMGG